MTTFFLIRHASCEGLGQTIWGRTPGICLNEQGRLQVQQLAERLEGTKFDAIYSSPLQRALETADVIASHLKLELRQSDALNEIDYGEWSGKTLEELHRDERWLYLHSHRSTASIPGGESILEVQNRIVKEIIRLAHEHVEGYVAIVSHAAVIRAAVGYFAATPIDLIERFEISPCSVSVIILDEEGPRILRVNADL
jgi:broad specificity phosphatase PhoE